MILYNNHLSNYDSFKDALVCSHLTQDDLKEVILFCKYHWLFYLARVEKMKQLVVWKEVRAFIIELRSLLSLA